jgi:hypothetical protein
MTTMLDPITSAVHQTPGPAFGTLLRRLRANAHRQTAGAFVRPDIQCVCAVGAAIDAPLEGPSPLWENAVAQFQSIIGLPEAEADAVMTLLMTLNDTYHFSFGEIGDFLIHLREQEPLAAEVLSTNELVTTVKLPVGGTKIVCTNITLSPNAWIPSLIQRFKND